MPTGYTAPVQDGRITEFRDFAMTCARAFGATVTMRDDPQEAPIPEEFEPSDYYSKLLVEVLEEIKTLQSMSEEDKVIAAQKSFEEEAASWGAYEAKKADGIDRYRTMLVAVEAWEPPTPEHVGLKEFMTKQLLESIEFDGGPAYSPRPTLKPSDQWFSEALQKAYCDLAYFTDEQSKEIERTNKRNEWVRALRPSLSEARGGSSNEGE